MSRPLVSIITPSYNQARFLGVCLQSVACQDYGSIEHVVVDGGSSDSTLELLQGARGVIWVSRPDGGQADAVNKGFAISHGEIIGWINSDDALFSRDAISAVVNAFNSDPAVDAVFGHTALVAEDGLILRQSRSFAPGRRRRVPRTSSPISQPSIFFRRELLEANTPVLDVALDAALDLDLMLRLVAGEAQLMRISRVLVLDRDHPDRKVRVLAQTYRTESEKVMAARGFRVYPPPVERTLAWGRRFAGLTDVLFWHRYESAADWHFDSLGRRVLRQLFKSHRQIVGAPAAGVPT